ncbi:GNAT family N-acetyltransferase [Vibrio penaeicida]|uniref:N-acetyltransferase domain-containing protein n=1 Tax=Vibrio penaeicida TaxID=104609 RepID=A0AAV5NU61_9VIBR|nr:GNAT family N-acetyltransferase [Vibrio penaeicida]RTZ24214.1 GNAT family N-acetyltransferase [Vibrio penaeicida]GLQ74250.1 hypothetical protein GCM10007932_36110 [Vibrio penaeicida]
MKTYIRTPLLNDVLAVNALLLQQHNFHKEVEPTYSPDTYQSVTEEDFITFSEESDTEILLLCKEESGKEHVIGVAMLKFYTSPYPPFALNGSSCYINQLVVDKEHRGMNLGTSMLREIEGYCAKYGFNEIFLDCWCANELGQNFYANNDFKPIRSLMSKEVELDHRV